MTTATIAPPVPVDAIRPAPMWWVELGSSLERLAFVADRLAARLDRERPAPLLFRMGDLVILLRIDRPTIRRLRRSGRFPRPDIRVDRLPLWRAETIRGWLERGGRS